MTYTIFWTKYAGQDKNPPKQDGGFRTESINDAYLTMQSQNTEYSTTWKGFVGELKVKTTMNKIQYGIVLPTSKDTNKLIWCNGLDSQQYKTSSINEAFVFRNTYWDYRHYPEHFIKVIEEAQ